MNKGRLGVSILLGALTVFYPLIVYVSISTLPMGALIGVLAVALLGRLVLGAGKGAAWQIAAGVGLVFCLLVWLSDSETGLLYYPVVMNGAMLLVFAASLIKPPSVIEQLARLSEPDLPAEGVAYTRKVTGVWCGFFGVNGLIALSTAISGDMAVWALYNGALAYVFMGMVFAIEWLVRRKIRARES